VKITKRQLRRIIREVHPDYQGLPQSDIDYYELADDYAMWSKKNGHVTPAASSVMATYFLEKGLQDDHEKHEMLGKAFKVGHDDIMRDIKRQQSEKVRSLSERGGIFHALNPRSDSSSNVKKSERRPELQAILDAAKAAHGSVPFAELKQFFWGLNSHFANKREIMESMQFAPTAQEEAEKINAQTGAGYVTDQAFWEKQGVITGEDLAVSVLNQTYSDFYKGVHGFRPRQAAFTSVEQAQKAIDDLDDYYMGMAQQEEIEAARQAQIEKERDELEALMPGEFDFQDLPKQAGMGRRMETRMRITKKDLKKIIREALLSEAGDDISNSEFTKELKTGAADIASSVPAKMNDDLARVIKTMTAMAQFDRSKFEKMVGYADSLGANALEKAEKGEKPPEEEK